MSGFIAEIVWAAKNYRKQNEFCLFRGANK